MKSELPGASGLVGAVLAASPALGDPNFRETLVYIAEHDKNGSFGLVLNRPLGTKLGDVVDAAGLAETVAAVPVYYGGPVQPDSLVLALFLPGEDDVGMQCRLNIPLEQVEAHLEDGTGWVRAFAGYSGWGEGQLEGELADEAWNVCSPDEALFNDALAGGLWSVYVAGDNRWRKLIPHLPPDSSLN